MSEPTPDGGPAFPQDPTRVGTHPSNSIPSRWTPSFEEGSRGMSLRDYFAGQALAGMGFINGPRKPGTNDIHVDGAGITRACYGIADAMIEAREPTETRES